MMTGIDRSAAGRTSHGPDLLVCEETGDWIAYNPELEFWELAVRLEGVLGRSAKEARSAHQDDALDDLAEVHRKRSVKCVWQVS